MDVAQGCEAGWAASHLKDPEELFASRAWEVVDMPAASPSPTWQRQRF